MFDSLRKRGGTIVVAAIVGAVAAGSPAVAAQVVAYAKSAGNANTVNKIGASKTPHAGMLVPLNAKGQFPAAVIPASRQAVGKPARQACKAPRASKVRPDLLARSEQLERRAPRAHLEPTAPTASTEPRATRATKATKATRATREPTEPTAPRATKATRATREPTEPTASRATRAKRAKREPTGPTAQTEPTGPMGPTAPTATRATRAIKVSPVASSIPHSSTSTPFRKPMRRTSGTHSSSTDPR